MARAKEVDLQAEIGRILDDYGDSVAGNIKEITKRVAQQGAKAVKAKSANTFKRTGGYAKSWTSKVETDYMSATGIIYSKKPGRPHLLEHGHAKRGGGRVKGKVHIGEVEQQLIREFEEAIKKAL